MACHQVGPSARNGIGPVLNGVVGRPAGVYPGYSYSSANKSSGLVWDEQTLTRYLRAPAEVVPGTKMIFFGLKKSQDVADVIAYLNQFDRDGQQRDLKAERFDNQISKARGAQCLLNKRFPRFAKWLASSTVPRSLQSAIDELLSSGFHRAELSLLASEHAVVEKLGHQYTKVKRAGG